MEQNHLMELSPFSIRLKHPKASLLSSLFDLELRHKKDREKLDGWGGLEDYPGKICGEIWPGFTSHCFNQEQEGDT